MYPVRAYIVCGLGIWSGDRVKLFFLLNVAGKVVPSAIKGYEGAG